MDRIVGMIGHGPCFLALLGLAITPRVSVTPNRPLARAAGAGLNAKSGENEKDS